jgi:threonine dehydrogenase-like Zn-dependent dehydrogenase
MRAAVMRDKRLVVEEIAEPSPGPGQLLAATTACGICGSDLHALKHIDKLVVSGRAAGEGVFNLDPTKDIVMGHEFAAEVLELGAGATGVAPGDTVVAMPVMFDMAAGTMQAIGYSNEFPGGYAERMLLSAMVTMKVPNGLDSRHAALTEPMAVGLHAVNKSKIVPGEAALVLGCGPVGLACIAALALRGIEPIVATDYSPKRRELARVMGAHETIDPRVEPAIDAWRRVDGSKTLVVFEAVGVPGMIDQAMRDAPRWSRILVVGVCMETDSVWPIMGINKELSIQFALGYDPLEFGETLRAIADGRVDVAPLITGEVGIAGVPQAFEDLADPDAHAKILVIPALG